MHLIPIPPRGSDVPALSRLHDPIPRVTKTRVGCVRSEAQNADDGREKNNEEITASTYCKLLVLTSIGLHVLIYFCIR